MRPKRLFVALWPCSAFRLSGLVCLELWRFVSKWIYPQALALSVCRQRGSSSLKNPFHHASHPAWAFGSAKRPCGEIPHKKTQGGNPWRAEATSSSKWRLRCSLRWSLAPFS